MHSMFVLLLVFGTTKLTEKSQMYDAGKISDALLAIVEVLGKREESTTL